MTLFATLLQKDFCVGWCHCILVKLRLNLPQFFPSNRHWKNLYGHAYVHQDPLIVSVQRVLPRTWLYLRLIIFIQTLSWSNLPFKISNLCWRNYEGLWNSVEITDDLKEERFPFLHYPIATIPMPICQDNCILQHIANMSTNILLRGTPLSILRRLRYIIAR